MSRIATCLVVAALAAGAFPAPAAAQVSGSIVIQNGPPAPRYEVVPRPRHGYVWAPGYWRWNGYRHVWVPGYWVHNHRGRIYTPGHWEQGPNGWIFVRPGWHRPPPPVPGPGPYPPAAPTPYPGPTYPAPPGGPPGPPR
jgi:hypothetical protein